MSETPMTPERLAEIRARWAGIPADERPRFTITDSSRPGSLLDAVHHAPEDVAGLLAEVTRLRGELAATRRAKAENDDRFQAAYAEQRERAESSERRLSAVLDLCDREVRNAVRWENPIPAPEWVPVVQRLALGDDKRGAGAS